jgi:hypothetical protein
MDRRIPACGHSLVHVFPVRRGLRRQQILRLPRLRPCLVLDLSGGTANVCSKALPGIVKSESPSKSRSIVIRCLTILGFVIVIGFLFPQVSTDTTRHGHYWETRSFVDGLLHATNAYATEYGSPVSGSPAQILATLRGDNPRKIIFFDTVARCINGQGELIDPWGTPYRFDLSDAEKPRIWSCGRNRKDEGGAEGTDDIASWRVR